MDIIPSREWEFTQAIGEHGWVGGCKRPSVTGGGQLAVDDVVAFDGGLSVWVVGRHVLKSGFKNVNHA